MRTVGELVLGSGEGERQEGVRLGGAHICQRRAFCLPGALSLCYPRGAGRGLQLQASLTEGSEGCCSPNEATFPGKNEGTWVASRVWRQGCQKWQPDQDSREALDRGRARVAQREEWPAGLDRGAGGARAVCWGGAGPALLGPPADPSLRFNGTQATSSTTQASRSLCSPQAVLFMLSAPASGSHLLRGPSWRRVSSVRWWGFHPFPLLFLRRWSLRSGAVLEPTQLCTTVSR